MIPETAKRPDWPRLVKGAFETLRNRLAIVEANKTFASVIFTPGAAPSSPVEGQTYQDSTTHKLRTWDGTAWQDHW